MKRKTGVLILSVLMLFLIFAGCNQNTDLKTDIYRFEDYASDEVFDIEKVDLSKDLAEKCSTYKFTYLSDSYKIKAYISVPVSAIKSQKPTKCVMYNRGGNRRIGLLDDNTTAKICIACDRIVVASQYRGAVGCEGFDQFGGDDLNDVIKLINLCEDEFDFIDMDDFCVAGVSRGGMMTYMAARQDGRIKRIISVSGVSDLFQAYEDRDDMKEWLVESIGYTPQENPTEYEKRSAICWYDEIKIPVLIIHSTQDEMVSYKQAEELYKKLENSTECQMITHEDNVHGLHSEDFKTINEWLNKL